MLYPMISLTHSSSPYNHVTLFEHRIAPEFIVNCYPHRITIKLPYHYHIITIYHISLTFPNFTGALSLLCQDSGHISRCLALGVGQRCLASQARCGVAKNGISVELKDTQWTILYISITNRMENYQVNEPLIQFDVFKCLNSLNFDKQFKW